MGTFLSGKFGILSIISFIFSFITASSSSTFFNSPDSFFMNKLSSDVGFLFSCPIFFEISFLVDLLSSPSEI